MNALLKSVDAPVTMTSREMADLTEKRHDSVKRTIDTLAKQGVITLPQIEEVSNDGPGPKTIEVYRIGKRDSYVIVAQLSPEFTARLVDRWQELEAGATPSLNLRDPRQLAAAALQLIEVNQELQATIDQQQRKIEEAAPKVQALDRFAGHEGKHGLRDAAKLLGLQESKLKTYLLLHKWYYRDHGGRLCAYADKISAGHLDAIPVEIKRTDGVQVVQQPVITQKGLSRLAEMLAKDGLLNRATT